MRVKHICVITGSRAEYNYLKLIIEKIDKSPKLELSLIITGMHLLKRHGNTIDLIKKDKLPIVNIIPMYDEEDYSDEGLGKAIGMAISKFTKVLNKLKPDLLLVLGDRYEPLVAVIAASTLKIPIAHMHGGDISGSFDDIIRHVLTKMSHVHFPATIKSSERIKLLGEEEERIHIVGSTSIDLIMKESLLSNEQICRRYELNSSEKIVICIVHPNIYEAEKAGEQMRITLQVLKDLNLQTIIIYPNNDHGSIFIIEEIKKIKDFPKFKIFKNLDKNDYYSLLKVSDLLLGNSSSGIIESPIFKLPVVNLGSRNENREKAENVINARFEYDELKTAVLKALTDEFRSKCQTAINPYGDGKATERIIKILEQLEITDGFLAKKLTYDI